MEKAYKNPRNRREFDPPTEKGENRNRLTELYHLQVITTYIQLIFWAVIVIAIILLGILFNVGWMN